MPTLTPAPPISPASSTARRWPKYLLWTLMALATLSVLVRSEIPLLRRPQEQAQLHAMRWLLIPHALAATLAFLSGPFQFSTRLRQRRPKFHRMLGYVYVGSVVIAAPSAIASTAFNHYPRAIYFGAAITVQGGAWLISTSVALLAAIHRRMARHREWMIRSYAVTFTFIGTRVLQPLAAWRSLGRRQFAFAIVCITMLALLTPQIDRSLSRLGRGMRRA